MILKAVSVYRPVLEEALRRVNEYLESTMPDSKLRNKVKDEVWLRITGQFAEHLEDDCEEQDHEDYVH